VVDDLVAYDDPLHDLRMQRGKVEALAGVELPQCLRPVKAGVADGMRKICTSSR
jgi:hypothetical protein